MILSLTSLTISTFLEAILFLKGLPGFLFCRVVGLSSSSGSLALIVGETGVGETGVGEIDVGEIDVGETDVGECRSDLLTTLFPSLLLLLVLLLLLLAPVFLETDFFALLLLPLDGLS